MNATIPKGFKEPTKKIILEYSVKVQEKRGSVTTLDVKKLMRKDKYWIEQEDISESLIELSEKLGWDWYADNNHRVYSVKLINKVGDPIKKQAVRDWIESNIKNGKIFGVTFIKKDGNIRNMVCRMNVTRGIKGTLKDHTTLTRKQINYYNSQITVFDMVKQDFRQVNLKTLQEIRFNKKVHKVI